MIYETWRRFGIIAMESDDVKELERSGFNRVYSVDIIRKTKIKKYADEIAAKTTTSEKRYSADFIILIFELFWNLSTDNVVVYYNPMEDYPLIIVSVSDSSDNMVWGLLSPTMG